MTQTSIKDQINAINQATLKALESKEAAIKFLTVAGIIRPDDNAISDPDIKSTKQSCNWDNTNHSK